MFSKTDGPTALRADLLRALAFSAEPIERLVAGRSVGSVAALAGVWNGKKGHVAVLIRDVEPAAIERYVSDAPITTEAMLDAVVEEGVAFAESLGFSLDAPDFLGLSSEQREARLLRWNKLRKVRKPEPAAAPAPTPAALDLDLPELPPVPKGYEIEPDELAVPQPAPPLHLDLDLEIAKLAADPAVQAAIESPSPSQVQNAHSTVLGRISLVRRGSADARRMELIARLLAFY